MGWTGNKCCVCATDVIARNLQKPRLENRRYFPYSAFFWRVRCLEQLSTYSTILCLLAVFFECTMPDARWILLLTSPPVPQLRCVLNLGPAPVAGAHVFVQGLKFALFSAYQLASQIFVDEQYTLLASTYPQTLAPFSFLRTSSFTSPKHVKDAWDFPHWWFTIVQWIFLIAKSWYIP